MWDVETARQYARMAHQNQRYGEFQYTAHLVAVERVLVDFGFGDDDELLAAAWLHDVLEDTNRTYEELAAIFSERTVRAVADVTEPKCGNRKWRHAQTYPNIRHNQDATIVNLADRTANVEMGGAKVYMYVREHTEFKKAIYHGHWVLQDKIEPMWTHLDKLIIEVQRS